MGRWVAIVLTIIALITVGFIVAAAIFPEFRAASRDIALVVLAVFQMIGALLTIALLVAIIYAVQAIRSLARDTLIPKIDTLTARLDRVIDSANAIAANAKDTSATVSTTTGYIAEQVVSPVIRLSGLFAGVRAGAAYLAKRGARPESDKG